MKKLIIFFTVVAFAMCPFIPSTGNDRIPSSDGVEEIIFHISGEAGDIIRTPGIAPFSCYALANLNMLLFYSCSVTSCATVTVEDLTTGDQQVSEIVIGPNPAAVYIPATVDVFIVVALENGQHYSALVSL